jgi:3-oxoacyl-[acyl-carrier protein] reductase
MNTIDLTGQTAFVTGSTRGIGRAIAQVLYAAGAKVAIVGREAERAQVIAAELGDRAVGVGCDVADGVQVDMAVAAAERALGPVTILVNNAGLTRDNILLRLSEADGDAVLDGNLWGAVLTTRAVFEGMM